MYQRLQPLYPGYLRRGRRPVRAAQQHLVADIERDAADLAAQHECVRLKEELAQQKGAEKHTELFIERLYYFEMWRSVCPVRTLSLHCLHTHARY